MTLPTGSHGPTLNVYIAKLTVCLFLAPSTAVGPLLKTLTAKSLHTKASSYARRKWMSYYLMLSTGLLNTHTNTHKHAYIHKSRPHITAFVCFLSYAFESVGYTFRPIYHCWCVHIVHISVSVCHSGVCLLGFRILNPTPPQMLMDRFRTTAYRYT